MNSLMHGLLSREAVPHQGCAYHVAPTYVLMGTLTYVLMGLCRCVTITKACEGKGIKGVFSLGTGTLKHKVWDTLSVFELYFTEERSLQISTFLL